MKKKLHFIGIGGIGMSGLAKLMLMQKHQVSGSDTSKSDILQKLEEMGALIHLDQKEENIQSDSTVVVTTDISEDNPELVMAKKLNLPILHRSDLLKILSEEKFGIAVAGTHGKTTTSTLLVQVLEEANLEPSFSIGGLIIPNVSQTLDFQPSQSPGVGRSELARISNTSEALIAPTAGTFASAENQSLRHVGYKDKISNAIHTASPYFVFEACESDGTLVKYHPEAAMILNIDNDHMNHYKTWDRLIDTFRLFSNQVQKNDLLFVHEDVTFPHSGIRFGFSDKSDLIAKNVRPINKGYLYDITFKGIDYKDVFIHSPLKHNVLNSLAVFGLCIHLQVKEEFIRDAFSKFAPPKKRLDIRYDKNEVLLIDDYGHHPTEIASTLESVRKAWPLHRILCLFQPHRYSRVNECLAQFKESFNACDTLIVTDIYGAGEKPIPGLTALRVQEAIEKRSTYVDRKNLAQEVHSYLRPFDLVISFGAGDISKIHDEIISLGEIKPLKIGLVYGGRSAEHEVSCSSSQLVQKGLDQEIFETVSLYIDREGNWHHGHSQISLGDAIDLLKKCDAAFPILHGRYGEDGTIQGMFEMLDIPYVGGPSIFNQITMDKAFTKMVAQSHGIQVTPFKVLKKGEVFSQDPLKFPLFVKPVHLGSSVGVRRVETAQELQEAISYAFQFDHKLIIEEEVIGREIEFAVLETIDGPVVFHPGEVLTNGKIYSFEAKCGENAFACDPQAKIPLVMAEIGKQIAKTLFTLLDGRGYARVDFFLDNTGQFWFNEVNPIPGFTKISLLPKIAALNGYPIEKLTTHLVSLCLHHSRVDRNLRHVPS